MTRQMKAKAFNLATVVILLISFFSFSSGQQMRWYKHYFRGLAEMMKGLRFLGITTGIVF